MTGSFKNDEKELMKIFFENTLFSDGIKMDNLERRIFNQQGPPSNDLGQLGIELIVRPECNQKCSYCYIHNFGKELYPIEERVSNEQILNNLRILLNYIFNEQKVYINRWELFAGDLFYDDFIFDIYQVFYDILLPINQMYKMLMVQHPIFLLMPCNCSFITNSNQVQKLEEWIKKFREINVDIVYSCSTDGKYATLTREGKQLDDDYWNTLFTFLEKHHWGCHPMVAADNIDKWIENYDWWCEQYQKYDLGTNDFQPMMLEVRNDNWTPEKIQQYCQLLDHMITKRLQLCDNELDKLAYHLFKGDGRFNTLPALNQYDPIKLQSFFDPLQNQKISCSIQGLIHITLNNLNIVPCHRTCYRQFRAGQFIVEDGKIIDFEPFNVNTFLSILYVNATKQVKCINCIYNRLCLKGCLGAQYETNGEIFQPAISVCNFFEAKYNFLITKYYQMGIIPSAISQGLIEDNMIHYYEEASMAYLE